MSDSTPFSRRRFLRTLPPLTVGAALLFQRDHGGPPSPENRIYSDMDKYVIPAGTPPSQVQLIRAYDAAYRAFEDATDAVFVEIATKMKEHVIPARKGIDVMFCPGQRKECRITLKADTNRTIGVPSIDGAFEAYGELCRQRKNLSRDILRDASLCEVPADEAMTDFITRRLQMRFSDTSLIGDNKDAIQKISRMFAVAGAFCNVRPQCGEELSGGPSVLENTLRGVPKMNLDCHIVVGMLGIKAPVNVTVTNPRCPQAALSAGR